MRALFFKVAVEVVVEVEAKGVSRELVLEWAGLARVCRPECTGVDLAAFLGLAPFLDGGVLAGVDS